MGKRKKLSYRLIKNGWTCRQCCSIQLPPQRRSMLCLNCSYKNVSANAFQMKQHAGPNWDRFLEAQLRFLKRFAGKGRGVLE